jgi:hypothetical protein
MSKPLRGGFMLWWIIFCDVDKQYIHRSERSAYIRRFAGLHNPVCLGAGERSQQKYIEEIWADLFHSNLLFELEQDIACQN